MTPFSGLNDADDAFDAEDTEETFDADHIHVCGGLPAFPCVAVDGWDNFARAVRREMHIAKWGSGVSFFWEEHDDLHADMRTFK